MWFRALTTNILLLEKHNVDYCMHLSKISYAALKSTYIT